MIGQAQGRRRVVWLAVLVGLVSIGAAHAGDWPNFRGPASNSAVGADEGPADWNLDAMQAWKVELPGRGPSSPIVVGGRVIVTASSGNLQDRLHVLCFDAAHGKPLWHRQFWATGRTITHPQTANAAPTPASDGRQIFAFFSSNDLAALDLQGNLLWYRGLGHDDPRAGNDVGMAASPLVVDGAVIVQSESLGDAFVVALETADGSTRWRQQRERQSSWTSPALLTDKVAGKLGVLIQSSNRLSCLDPADGRQRWQYERSCDGIASCCAVDGQVFLPAEGLTALRPTAGAAEPEVLWKAGQLAPGAASPIVAAGKIYLINRSGVLIVAEAGSGEILSRSRLEGSIWSTPVLCGRHLLAINQDGLAQVVDVGEDPPRVVAKLALGETVQASPAVAGGAVYVRSQQHLRKLASPPR